MSDCVYSDAKLKKVHYHLHYKKDGSQAVGGIQTNHVASHKGTHSAHFAQSQNAQVGQTQRVFNTGFIQVDTSQIETIDINQKLLAERDSLRIRVMDLEQQLMSALEIQKEEILSACESRYNEQFSQIEIQHSKQIQLERQQTEQLKQQLKEVTAKINTYEENGQSQKQTIESFEKRFEKQSEKNKKEKEQMKRDFQDQIDKQFNEILSLKDKARDSSGNNDKSSKYFYEEQISNLKSQISYKDQRIQKLEQDSQHYESQLHQKALEISSLQTQMKIQLSESYDKFSVQRQTTESEKYAHELKRQYEQTISRLEETITKQKDKIQKYKLQLSKQPVKLEPVIVERPVQVETVVENIKYIPIERVVKELGSDSRSNGVLLAQNSKHTQKESELMQHYEDIIEQQAYKVEQLQRKINTLTKIHDLQKDQQTVQEQQTIQAHETIRKFQNENDYLKSSLQNYEQNLNSITRQFEGSS